MNTLQPFSRLALRLAAPLLLAFVAPVTFAEDAKPSATAAESSSPTAEQETKLTTTLTDVTLKGRGVTLKDGQLGPEKEDAYHIVSLKKIEGDKWVVTARFQHGGQTMDVPIQAVVKWSGDTPVLLFDNVTLGGPRSYSARLMVSGDTYAGTWSGGDHGGMLYGLIVHESH